jgi:hypothetical protein
MALPGRSEHSLISAAPFKRSSPLQSMFRCLVATCSDVANDYIELQ